MSTETRPVQAWETELGDVVVWGTHDPDQARAALEAYALEADAEINLNDYDFEHALQQWARPDAIDIEDAPWPKDALSYQPVDGWVPVLLVLGP